MYSGGRNKKRVTGLRFCEVLAMNELTIKLNNRPYPYVEGTTVGSLMTENNFNFAAIIVKINGVVIEEDNWLTAAVSAGDNVEIIHIFGGG